MYTNSVGKTGHTYNIIIIYYVQNKLKNFKKQPVTFYYFDAQE